MDPGKAIILMSGGLDSTTTLAIAKKDGYEIILGLSFDYGQKNNSKEIDCAKRIAKYYKINHKVIKIDLPETGSALIDKNLPVPEDRSIEDIGKNIPITYVPGRNMIFLSFALAYAEPLGADTIFIGAHTHDYSGYPDCRPEFLKKFEEIANIGTKKGVEGRGIRLEYPLINMSKAEIIKRGMELGAPYHLTWSCYNGREHHCGKCDSCILRKKGFAEARVQDPILYR